MAVTCFPSFHYFAWHVPENMTDGITCILVHETSQSEGGSSEVRNALGIDTLRGEVDAYSRNNNNRGLSIL